MPTSMRSVVLHRRELDRLTRDPNGDVGRFMSRLGGFITREAQSLADARLNIGPGARFRDGSSSGEYRGSFRTTTIVEARGLRTRVTNTAPHASYLENGTRPHVIRPKRPGGVLVFVTSIGNTVFAREVHHPGTRPYRILADALRRGIQRAR